MLSIFNNKPQIITESPKALIKLLDDELKLMYKKENFNKNIKVISIIGNGRTGKSTFLNCISSHLNKKNTKIFDVQDTDEHCTNGIDMYHFEDENIILLDCQGLQLDDSSHDPQLLLITYLISDCIIYNQKSMINNDIFNTLQPLTSFINYLEDVESNKNKPILYFRLSDVELNFDMDKHLEKSLKNKKDQYQNVRDAIKTLFSKVCIGTTNTLDRSEKKLFEQNKFYDFLNNKENNFEAVISSVLNLPLKEKQYDIWYDTINEYINKINSNQKINFNKLDVYQLLVEKEILEFKLNISSDNYADFSIGPLQSDYDTYVKPKIEYKNNCLRQFKNKFNLVTNSFFELNYNEIKEKLENPINKAIKQMELLSNNAIKAIENTVFTNVEYIIHYKDLWENYILQNKSLTKTTAKKLINIEIISAFYEKIGIYYKQVYDQYVDKYENLIDNMIKYLINFVKDNINAIKYFTNLIKNISNNISEINNKLLKSKIYKYTSSDLSEFKNQIIMDYIIGNILTIDSMFENKNNNYVGSNLTENINNSNLLKIYYKENNYILDSNIVVNMNNLSYITKQINNDKIAYKYLCDTIVNLTEEINNNEEFNIICKTKAKQNKILLFGNIVTIKDGKIDGKKINIDYGDGSYNLDDIKKSYKITEFNKWLIKKYNKNIAINKNKLFNLFLYGSQMETEKQIIKLYNDFKIDYELLNNNFNPYICVSQSQHKKIDLQNKNIKIIINNKMAKKRGAKKASKKASKKGSKKSFKK